MLKGVVEKLTTVQVEQKTLTYWNGTTELYAEPKPITSVSMQDKNGNVYENVKILDRFVLRNHLIAIDLLEQGKEYHIVVMVPDTMKDPSGITYLFIR